MLTAELIKKACPNATDAYVEAFGSPAAQKVFAAHGITSPRVMAAMMANIDHETGGLTIVREDMRHSEASAAKAFGKKTFALVQAAIQATRGKSRAERERAIANAAYGYRGGNEDDGTNDDDGYRYRGGGPLQTTFKPNYRALEKLTGLPFGSRPELIEDPAHWALVACLTFTKHLSAGNLVPFAEQGNFLACCKAINTGSPFSPIKVNGLADREAKYVKWCGLLEKAGLSVVAFDPAAYRYGMPFSSMVARIQARLNELRYAEGRLVADGVFGDRTRSAVMDFQLKNGLAPVDGVVGDLTWNRLFADDATPWPPPAAVALGVDGMRKAGDPEIAAADKDRAAGVALLATASLTAANSSGLLDLAGEVAKSLTGWQAALSQIIAAAKFGATNLVAIGIAMAGLYLINRFRLKIADAVGRWLKPVGAA